jgi:hypothetical protein
MQPYWRPNFVNQAELPDIKVIRTDFIINLIAVILALGLTCFLLQREYRSYVLSKTVSELEQQIRVADADDQASLKYSKSFYDAAQYVVEVEKFFDAPILAHEFLYRLSELRPKDLIYNSVSWDESVIKVGEKNVVKYTVNISGDAKDLTVIGDFKNIIESAELFQISGFDLLVSETLRGRDEKTRIFPYRLAISLTPSKPAPKKASQEGDAS